MAKRKPADILQILTAGGEVRIALLRVCIYTVRMEAMFLFLAQEYRLRPSHTAALALYDLFCTANAPANIAVGALIAPTNVSFHTLMRTIRRQTDPATFPGTLPTTAPHKHLFDDLVRAILEDPAGSIAWLRGKFNPRRTPAQHMPGGKISPAQLHFVNHVWRPLIRPRLTAAGFWQIAAIE